MLTRHMSTIPVQAEGITTPMPPNASRNVNKLREITQLKTKIKKLQQELSQVLGVDERDWTIKE
jgi:hypothetical protein